MARRKIGFVFQFYNLLPVLTAQRNVELPLRDVAECGPMEKNAATALQSSVDRAAHKPGELSGG
jgi:putative ABC transport system ATP-binding protein